MNDPVARYRRASDDFYAERARPPRRNLLPLLAAIGLVLAGTLLVAHIAISLIEGAAIATADPMRHNPY